MLCRLTKRPAASTHRRLGCFLKAIVLIAPWWCAAARAGADDAGASMFSLSGFGTLGVVHSSEGRADFTSTFLKPNGTGFSHAWSTDVDSRLGGQVIAHATSQLSAVVQVISEQLYDNSYRPHVEWANVKYEVTPEFNLRVGRTVLPSFMFSDTRKVGYSNPWVRPPVEVYNLVPITNSDGVDASYEFKLGAFGNRLTGTYGKSDPRLPPSPGGSAHGRHLWLLSDTVEYGDATVHVAYQSAHLDIPSLNGIFDALRNFGPQGIELANRYDLTDKMARFIGLGAQYDPGQWFALSEWGRTQYHSVLGESTAWYASGGYRWAKLTPYLTYSDVRANSNTSDPGLVLSTLPTYLVAPAIELNAGLNSFLGSITIQKTITLGARWDVLRNLALKLQYDHTRLGPGSPGTLINRQPDYRPGGTVNLISATIDFVL
jgi:hypothetical protein